MYKVSCLFAILSFLQFAYGGQPESKNLLLLDIRLCLSNDGVTVIYKAKNTSSQLVKVDLFQQRGNSLGLTHLSDAERKTRWSSLNVRMVSGKPPRIVEIAPDNVQQWKRDVEKRWVHLRRGYELHTWRVRVGEYPDSQFFQSKNICLGFPDSEGNIAPPVVDPRDPTAKPILAFVFNENQTNEVGFLFLNGSNETVNVEKPLTQASRIVATAPAIGYTNELFIAGQPSESIAIKAGKVGEWRIPWKTIHDLIPAADLAAIKAAGGSLDLVWKVGEFESPILPLSLDAATNGVTKITQKAEGS